MPSPAASFRSCRDSYASTQSAPSWATKRRECGGHVLVRRSTYARRTGRATGPATRRACQATLIGRKRTCGCVHYHRASVATDLETASVRDTASPEQEQPRRGKSRGPVAALCAVTIAAFALYALLSLPVGGPRVHP